MDAIRDVASRSAFTLGDAVEGFEEDFARFCGAPHAIGVSSGTIYSYHYREVLSNANIDVGQAEIGNEVVV